MSKSNKKELDQKQIEKQRKEHLRIYLELKAKNPQQIIRRSEFTKYSKISTRQIRNYWNTWTNLKQLGEAEFLDNLPKSQRALLTEIEKTFDPHATKDDVIEDLRAVQKAYPLEFITRTTYRNCGRYSDSTWNRYFGTFQEFRRQAGLELTRHQHQLERHIAKHASLDHYNEFFDSEVLPYYNKYQKPISDQRIKTIMIIGDLHDRECDEFTLEVFIDTCRKKQPDIIVLNGDIFDFYEFSKFTKDPRNCDVVARYKFVHERIFKPLRKYCPNAQIDFIVGNHEFRLLKMLADITPHLRVLLSDVLDLTFEKVFQLDKYQINWRSKLNLRAFNKRDIEDEIKKNYAIYYNCYVVAHVPDPSLRNMDGCNSHHHKAGWSSYGCIDPNTHLAKKTTWVQTPAGHVTDAEYLDKVSSANTGFLEVTVNTEKQECIQKIILTKNDWAVIDGILYTRKKA